MKITKDTNLQNIDFAQAKIEPSATEKKPCRLDVIGFSVVITMCGIGLAHCMFGETQSAVKVFTAGIITCTALFYLKQRIEK